MPTAIGRQESVAAAFGTVDDAGQVDAALADQPAAKLDRETGRGEQRRRIAQGMIERGGDAVDVQRLVARAAGDVETAAEV
jgi:hypothetical protein